jgi:hypothetical protein
MGPAITALNATSGTRRYMAPEQARGQDDERADQFSLAAVLFEMLAGQLPWPMPRRNDGGEHERFVAAGKYKQLREVRPEVPEGLDAVVMRALSADPDQRFASVFEFAKELLPYATPEAQVMFRKYGENPGRVRALAMAVPVSQQVTVRRSYADQMAISHSAETRRQPAAGKPVDSEYATVASGVRPATRGTTRRYALGLTAVGLLGAAAVTLVIRGRGDGTSERQAGSAAPVTGQPIEQKPELAPIQQGVPAVTATLQPDAGRAQEGAAASRDEAPAGDVESGAGRVAPPTKKRPSLRRKDRVLRTPQGTAIPE